MSAKRMLLLFLIATAFAATIDIRVGQAIGPVRVRDRGKVVQLDALAQEAPVAVVYLRAISGEECKALDRVADQLAGNRVRVLALLPHLSTCSLNAKILIPSQPAEVQEQFSENPGRLVIVDTSGIVRLINNLPDGLPGISSAMALASEWENGRSLFSTNCGHCHGDDGADIGYPSIKTLAGISRRLSGPKILDGGQQFGAVDMSTWAKSSKEALLIYIQGL